MENLINPYGTEWHERLEKQGQKCAECGSVCTPEYVLSIHGFPDPLIFCDHKCLLKFTFENYWNKEDEN